MIKEKVNISKESRAQQKCRHYWIIEMAAGPNSRGVCKLCGAKREFGNYLRDCLEIGKEEYLEWAEGGRSYKKGNRKQAEDTRSYAGGGDKHAVDAGTRSNN